MHVTARRLPLTRYNADTKRLEGDLKGLVDGNVDTDYVVVASTLMDPKVDAAEDSGLEIDEVCMCLVLLFRVAGGWCFVVLFGR